MTGSVQFAGKLATWQKTVLKIRIKANGEAFMHSGEANTKF